MSKLFILSTSTLLFLLFALIGNYNIRQMHSGGFYRTDKNIEELGNVVYYKEGKHATVTIRETPLKEIVLLKDGPYEKLVVRELPNKGHSLFFNGYGQGGDGILDLRVNFLLSYIPLLIKPEAKNALVIGLGTGTTSGHLTQFMNTKTVEIESAVIEATNYFKQTNEQVLENPRHKLIIADARNYLLKNKEKYDLIVSEPTNTWQSFSTQLYSKEFYYLVGEHLNENGLYVLWVPIYDFNSKDFKNFYKTFSSIFPYNIAFANIKPDESDYVNIETSEIIIIGSKNKIELSRNIINKNYNSLPEKSKSNLNEINLNSDNSIYQLLLFTSDQMKGYAENALFVTDDRPLLEFSTAKNVLNQNPTEVINDINVFLK